MPLTQCIECQRPISESASSCPGCSTREPFGVLCEMCGARLPRSAGVTSVRHTTGLDSRDDDIVAHKGCLERYFTPLANLACPDCGLRLSGCEEFSAKTLWSASPHWVPSNRCPRCGAADPLGESVKCWGCPGPVYPFQVGPNGQGHGHPRPTKDGHAPEQDSPTIPYFLQALREAQEANKLSNHCSTLELIITLLKIPVAAVKSIVTLPFRVFKSINK
jgi:hypothetical protein